ncbi:ABC transporter substrate-binding protein [Bremerella cremea]|uniref:ABC transporter substrate-binding protein n=1 Tax=Bremerella cremea TaxID=1031537 RepID=UPI0031EBB836
MTFRISLLLFLSAWFVGCTGRSGSKDLPEIKTPPLSIAIVGDQAIAETIRRELAARSEDAITVDVVSSEVLFNEKRFTKDILIYPPAMMGDLIARDWIVPVPSATLNGDVVQMPDIAQGIAHSELRWGAKPYALPLGSPVLMLMARTDILKQFDLKVPQTWDEYASAVEKIHNSEFLKTNDVIAAATLEPLDEAYVPSLWLARSASYVKHGENLSTYFDFTSGKARIDTPGFTRAAKELAQIAATIPDEYNSLDPKASAEAFLSGKSVLALGWICKETIVADTVPDDIVFAPIPGSKETYQTSNGQWLPRPGGEVVSVPLLSTSGLVGSVSSSSGQTVKAADLLALLTSAEVLPLISPASSRTTLCRISSLPMSDAWMPGNLPGTALRQYAQVSMQQLQSPKHLSALRIPERDAYRQVVAEAIEKTIAKPADVDAIWKEAAAGWDSLSEKQGMPTHIKSFRNSQSIGDNAF